MIGTINGPIISDDIKWLYDWAEIPATCPADVRQLLDATPEGEALELTINSGGGSVFAGFEIYSMLRRAKCPTEAVVESLAASAASTIMVGCNKVILSPVAQVMIHLPTTGTEGNSHDHERSRNMLDSITESILNGYQLKCGGKADRDKLRQMMERESWLSAQDAVALGLADDILGAAESANALPFGVVNSVGNCIRAAARTETYDTASLMAQYEQAVISGQCPALEGHPVAVSPPAGGPENKPTQTDWARSARLKLENERFLKEEINA